MRRLLIVPAAGTGSRLGSHGPKFVAPVGGRPMLDILLDLYLAYVDAVALVVQPGAADAAGAYAATRGLDVRLAWQAQPTGMLDAVLAPRAGLVHEAPEQVWVTWCDQVAVDPRTVARLAAAADSGADLVCATAYGPDPYTCLVRDGAGRIVDILQRREGDPMPAEGESEMGLFALSNRAYFDWLPAFAGQALTGAATRERNFLPFVAWAAQRGTVTTIRCHDAREAIGVNTPADRDVVEQYLRERAGTEAGA